MDDNALRNRMRVGRTLLGIAAVAAGAAIFAEVWRHPQAYPWRQAAFGREPHWAIDIAFFVVIFGIWNIAMAWPRRQPQNPARRDNGL